MNGVKRRYDNSGRQERARSNRHRILDAARTRFLRDGYAATTVASIAADAGVSPQTVAKQFSNKPGLVRALFDVALTGDEEGGALEDRAGIVAIHDEPDPHRKLVLYGMALASMLPRTAPIQMLLRDSGDPALAEVWTSIKAGRLAGMANLAENLSSGGHLRDGVDVDTACDVLWTFSSPEVFGLLVGERGWTTERYAEFLADSAAGVLLSTSGSMTPPAATRGGGQR